MNRIKQLREENNWTQLELSKKMNCSMSSIAMYENETRKPSLEVLIKLSEIFNCSIDYILCKTDIRNPKKINIDEADIAFFNGIKGLNETNREILKNIINNIENLFKNDKVPQKINSKICKKCAYYDLCYI